MHIFPNPVTYACYTIYFTNWHKVTERKIIQVKRMNISHLEPITKVFEGVTRQIFGFMILNIVL